MTAEETAIHVAARQYAQTPCDETLALLVTTVMDLPLAQWPEGACPPMQVIAAEHVDPGILEEGL